MITMSKKMKRKYTQMGRVKEMKNGQWCIITDYRNNKDIDVQFEDGTIVNNRTLNKFNRGEIENPNYITVAHNMSTAEALTFLVLKEYFPSIVKHYTPNDGQNWFTSNVDMFIPEKGIAIEVDEYATHRLDLERFNKKENLITNSNKINKVCTIAERGCLNHIYAKNDIYEMSKDSHNFSSDKVSDEYKGNYFEELELVIELLLLSLGVETSVMFTEQMVIDVMSKKNKLKSYREYLADVNKAVA